MLYVFFGACFFAIIIALNFKDTITEVLKNRSTATQASPATTPTVTVSKKAAEYQWYVSYPAIAAAMVVVLLVITYAFPYWRAGYDIAGGPPWWLLILAVVAFGAVAMTTQGMIRTVTLTLSLSVSILVLSVYLVRGFANMPDCLDDTTCYEVAEVVRYPAPPPVAELPATSEDCPGTPPDPDKPLILTKEEEINPLKRCDVSYTIVEGEVELDDGKGVVWRLKALDYTAERLTNAIPVKVRPVGAEAKLYYMLCPHGTNPTGSEWKCKPSSAAPRGTTNEYGVAAGVDLRLGVFHTTD